MDVLITQDGDVIFKLNLPALINTPVHLFLTYEDATHEKDKKQGGMPYKMNRTTTISYNNTKTIIYIEFKCQLLFQVFRVGVALFNSPILGSIEMSQEIYSKQVYSKQVYSKQAYSKHVYSKQVYSKQVYSKQVYSKQVYSKQVYCKQVYSKQVYSKQVYSKQVYS